MSKKQERKFKVGDRVRFTNGQSPNFSPGVIYTLTKAFKYSSYAEGDGGIESEVSNCYLELVQESELEELVRKANEGYLAIELLNKRSSEVEFKNVDSDYPSWTAYSKVTYKAAPGREFRIKKSKAKPPFEPFELSNSGYTVALSSDEKHVDVGCKRFPTRELEAELVGMIKYNAPKSGYLGGLTATRNGVQYQFYTLTWADADQLLAALEKVPA